MSVSHRDENITQSPDLCAEAHRAVLLPHDQPSGRWEEEKPPSCKLSGIYLVNQCKRKEEKSSLDQQLPQGWAMERTTATHNLL